MNTKKILAIGGGKGGIGKSVIVANLGVELARRGNKTIVADMDFGASNLHIYLGLKSPMHGFKDFIAKRSQSLEEVLVDTSFSGLKLISAAGDLPGSANLNYWLKMKIISHIEKLPADYILLDMGPGDSFNVIDYFLISNIPILVVTPELASMMNAYSFLKSIVFRKLQRAFKTSEPAMKLIELSKDPDNVERIKTVRQLIVLLGEIDKERAEQFKSDLEAFQPKLIVNMSTNNIKDEIMSVMSALAKQYLLIELSDLGYIYEDDCIRESVSKMMPFVVMNNGNRASICVREIVDKLEERPQK